MLLKTPDPAEIAILVWVSPMQVLQNLDLCVPGVTKLKEFKGVTAPSNEYGVGDYVFTAKGETRDDGCMAFYFAKDKTALAASQPFMTLPRFGSHHWPMILLAIKFYKVHGFPHNTTVSDGAGLLGMAMADRYICRTASIPATNDGTLFFIEHFQSPRPFAAVQRAVPQAGTVSFSYLGVEGGFPECLHKDLQLPALRTSSSTVYSTGETTTGGALRGQRFRRTNFTRWRQHVATEDQSFDNGVYHKLRVRVRPPRGVRRTFQSV